MISIDSMLWNFLLLHFVFLIFSNSYATFIFDLLSCSAQFFLNRAKSHTAKHCDHRYGSTADHQIFRFQQINLIKFYI